MATWTIPMMFAAPSKPTATSTTQKPTPREISVENAKFAVFSRDISEPSDYISLKPSEKAAKQVKADPSHKLLLKFDVKDKKTPGGENLVVQQAFVVLVHQSSQREIVYVAEADSAAKTYIFEMDMKTASKEFSGVSGVYSARLIIGDASVTNPVNWNFANVEISVSEGGEAPSQLPKSQRISYTKAPEITHKFREPEARAPRIVSDAFAILCALPLLLLFALWLRVGINFGNAKYSLWALGFHAGLISIFGLYLAYWLQLNMFDTLKYLAIIGAPTFLCGNMLLRSFANSKSKVE